MNKAILIGNLGSDPEMSTTQSGTSVASFSVATSRKFRDRHGDMQEEVEWHRVVAFGKLAEIIGRYMHKGKQAMFEGRLQTRKWEDRDGNPRSTTEIIAENMEMLGGGRDDRN